MASVAGAQPMLDAFRSERERQGRILDSFVKSAALDDFAAHVKPNDKILKAIRDSGVMDTYGGNNDKLLKAIRGSGVMDAYSGSNDSILKAIRGSGVMDSFSGQTGKWLEYVRSTFDSSALFASFGAQEEARHRQLLAAVGRSPAIEQAFRVWQVTLPPGMAEQMADFQNRVLAEAAIESPPHAYEGNFVEPWFGEESWSRLVFHMVALLKCAELVTAGMAGAKMGLNAPIPSGVLYLLAVFIAAGELAAHFAEPAAKRTDELSGDGQV